MSDTPNTLDLTASTDTVAVAAANVEAANWSRVAEDLGPELYGRLQSAARANAARRVAGLVAAFTALLVVAMTMLPGAAGSAQAAVLPVTQPVKVVLAGPVSTLITQVIATAPTTAAGGRWVAVSAPLAGGQKRVAFGCSSTPIVTVRATLPSRLFVLGRSTWMTRDMGDGTLSPLAVDARQASRFAAARVTAAMPGYVVVGAQVEHYKAAAGAWVASQSSPVVVQVLTGASWMTLATVTTDRLGTVTAVVAAPPGFGQYRLVRPDGTQVWSATSPVLTADTGSPWDL